MNKNIIIILGILLVVFSGCSNDVLILGSQINDLNNTNYTTYSSNKIISLLLNTSGNGTGVTYSAGTGLILTSTTFSLNDTYLQNFNETTYIQNNYPTFSFLASNYYNKTELDTTFNNYYTKTNVFNKTEIQDNYVYYSYLLSNYYNGSYINSYFYNKSYIDLTFLNYYTATQITTNYYTKSNVYNKTESDANWSKYYLATNPNSYITSSALSPYVLTTTFNSIGNWTLDKTSYSTTTVANTLYIPISYNSSLGKVGTCGAGQVVQNVTSTGVQCVTDQTSAGGGYATIQDEATPLTQRTTLNFIGTGVSCVDNAGSTRTDCTISSGGGAGDGTGGWVNSTYETKTNLSAYQFGNNITTFKVSGSARSTAKFEDFGLTVATYQRITTAPTIDVTETQQTGSLINFPTAASSGGDGGYIMAGNTATNSAIINVSRIEKISFKAKLVATTNRKDLMGAFKSGTNVNMNTSLTGVFFRYNTTDNTTISAAVCNNNVCSTLIGITSDTNWHEYTIVSNANLTNPATQFTFYIDSVNKGTINTNIPTTLVSSVGTWGENVGDATADTLRLDWYYYQIYR